MLLLGDFQPGPEVSIGGIVIWRDTDDPRPTQQQVTMATALIRWLDVKYGIESVGAHRDYVVTECPGDNDMPFMPLFNAAS